MPTNVGVTCLGPEADMQLTLTYQNYVGDIVSITQAIFTFLRFFLVTMLGLVDLGPVIYLST